MTSDKSDIKNQLKITNTIYYSLIIGLSFFFIIAIIFIQDKESQTGSYLDTILTVLVPVYGFVMMLFSKVIYSSMIAKQSPDSQPLQKIIHYRTSRIISWAMIESGCILSLIAVMMTANYFYVVVLIFLFGYFILIKPSVESLVRDMQLRADESEILLRR
jgi:hypothetical protein